jgi:hypothetical protein
MMRALAVLSAAAVVLFALPRSAGAAADSATVAPAASQDASNGIVSFLSERSLFGMSLGAVLWLSVAALAALLALVALSRSRGHLAPDLLPEHSGQVARPEFAVTDIASAAR